MFNYNTSIHNTNIEISAHKQQKEVSFDYKRIIYDKEIEISELKKRLNYLNKEIEQRKPEIKAILL